MADLIALGAIGAPSVAIRDVSTPVEERSCDAVLQPRGAKLDRQRVGRARHAILLYACTTLRVVRRLGTFDAHALLAVGAWRADHTLLLLTYSRTD